MLEDSDLEFINKLFIEYRQMMFKVAMDILHNKADAEDAVQDAFLCIINNLEKISHIPCKEKAFYFVVIIENISINKYNKKNRHPLVDIDKCIEISSDYSVDKRVDEDLLIKKIKDALAELSDRDYSIMYLYIFNQMTPKEIAEKLDIPEKNIHTYITRAKKRLVKILNRRGIYYDI